MPSACDSSYAYFAELRYHVKQEFALEKYITNEQRLGVVR